MLYDQAAVNQTWAVRGYHTGTPVKRSDYPAYGHLPLFWLLQGAYHWIDEECTLDDGMLDRTAHYLYPAAMGTYKSQFLVWLEWNHHLHLVATI